MAIGYACISLGLSNSSMRSCTIRNADKERLDELVQHNLKTLSRLLDYNASRGISLFRISSDIIPFGSHPDIHYPWWNQHKELLNHLGSKIKKYCMRVSMHPGQYTVLNAQDPAIGEKAVRDLEYHARFLNCLGLDKQHKIILHLGGVYGDPDSSIRRFRDNYYKLPDEVRQRLTIENDEKYHIGQVVQLAADLKIPAVFDVFHHQCYSAPDALSICQWVDLCNDTWQADDGVQKIHYSQQEPDRRIGAHATHIQLKSFLDFYYDLPARPLDIMIECKDKDISAIKCKLAVADKSDPKQLEEEWRRYRYLVREHSELYCRNISEIVASNDSSAKQFYFIVEEALNETPTFKQVLIVADLIWGQIKSLAANREKAAWEELFRQFQKGEIKRTRLKEFLYRLVQKYAVNQLLETYYFVYTKGME